VNTNRQPFIGMIRLLILAVASLLLAGCGGPVNIITATPNKTQQAASAETSVPADASAATATRRTQTPKAANATTKPTQTQTAIPSTVDGLKTVSPADLPPEARQTLALIDSGGPFPYSRDGIVFQNREGILPKKSSSYYHEYTVVTPGSPDRGAKRMIAGSKGEIFYTEDHYVTFVRIIR
jgi:ribonuclease T1